MPDPLEKKFSTQISDIDKLLEELSAKRKTRKPIALPKTSLLEQKLSEGKSVFLTTENAESMGVEDFIDPDWMIKVSPGKDGSEPAFSYIKVNDQLSGQPKEYTEADIIVTPEGRWNVKSGEIFDYERNKFVPASQEDIDKRMKYYEQNPDVAPEGTPDTVTPEEKAQIVSGQNQELTTLLKGVFASLYEPQPEEAYQGITDNLVNLISEDQATQDQFLDTVRDQGRTPQNERLLRIMIPDITEEELDTFFGTNAPVTPETTTIQMRRPEWTTMDYWMENFFKPYGGKDLKGKAAASFVAGIGDVISTTGGAARWLGYEDAGKVMSTVGAKLQSVAPIEPEGEFEFADLLNPEYYATKVTRTIPFSLSLLPLAIGGTYGGAGLATALGTGRIASWIIGILSGTALSRPLESAMEAGGAYDDAIARGLTEAEAKKQADEVFANNMKLAGADAFEIAVALAPTPKWVPKKLMEMGLVRTAKVAGKMIIVGLSEGGEELVQEMITRHAKGEDFKLDPISKEVFAIGAVMGIGMGFGGDVISEVVNRTKSSISGKTEKAYNQAVADLQAQGLSIEEAELRALNTVITTPEGESLVKKIIREVGETAEKIKKGERGGNEAQKEPWQMTRQEFTDKEVALIPKEQQVSSRKFEAESIALTHRKLIEEAIAQGKPIPPEVLKDYPELATTTTAAPTESVAAVEGEKPITTAQEGLEIPKTEIGQPEAGLQTTMIPGEVSAKEIRPEGKGKLVQVSMEDQLALEKYKETVVPPQGGQTESRGPHKAEIAGSTPAPATTPETEVAPEVEEKVTLPGLSEEESIQLNEMVNELAGLETYLQENPVARHTFQLGMKKSGKGVKAKMVADLRHLDFLISIREGEFPSYFTVKQAQAVNPHKAYAKYLEKGTKNYNKVPRDEVFDQLATDLGVEDSERLAEEVMKVRKTRNRIKQIKQEIAILDSGLKPAPTTPTIQDKALVKSTRKSNNLTKDQTNKLIKLFAAALDNSETQRADAIALRKHVLAERISNMSATAEEIYLKTGDALAAVKQAELEAMSGSLPDVTTDYFTDLTEEMRKVLFSKVYNTLKAEPFELMSTIEALTNALSGKSIPRKPGTTGGSAYSRLQRVFGDEPVIFKAIEKMTEEHKELEDVVEGIFHETGREPIPLDEKTLEYMRSLSDIPRETETGQLVRIDARNLQMGLPSMTGKPWTPEMIADLRSDLEKQFAKDKIDLDIALADGVIDKDEYNLKLKIAEEFVKPFPPVTPYEAPIKDAISQVPLWPEPPINSIVRVLKEIGWSPVDIGGLIKAMKSSVDMSYWRQIMPLIPGHPTRFAMSNVEAWKALFSQKSAEASWYRITHDPQDPMLYPIYDKIQKIVGTDFLRPLDMPKGTEQFKGVEEFGYLTKDRMIPRLTAKLPNVRLSNRAFVTGLNSMLWNCFRDFYHSQVRISEMYSSGQIKLKPGESFDMVKNMAEYAKMLADWSGRAALGKIAPAGPILGNLLYAPRYVWGRVIGPRHLFSPNPYVRIQAWKDAVLFIGTIGGAVLTGAALGWWDVERDRNSADFMKIRIGTRHIDPWGGAQQLVVFFSRLFDIATAPLTGKPAMGKSSITGQEYPLNWDSLWSNLLESKSGPGLSLIKEYMTGKTFGGEKSDYKNWEQWLDRIGPMSLGDLVDALQESPTTVAVDFPLSFTGFGVQNYTGDWKENEKKIGLPKYSDNLIYGLTKPVYDTADFWSDTAKQFKGVDPAELTAQKGFNEKIRAISQALKVIEEIKDIPNQKLTSVNADPSKGDTYLQYYAQWQERQKIVASKDAEALKAFDADERTKNAKLGNMTQRQFVLLSEYHALPKSERAQFLKDNPEVGINPYQEWLTSHPNENAQLAVWGQATIYTLAAYKETKKLLKELDLPDSSLDMPPEKSAEEYFKYLKTGEDLGYNSWETQLIIAKDDALREWLKRDKIETPVASLELKVKNRDLFEARDAFSDKTSDKYISDEKEREKAIKKLKEDNPGWVDDMRRIEAIEGNSPDDKTTELWVERGKLIDKFTAGSSEAMVWLNDHPEVHKWALDQKLLEDTGKDWNIPALEINVKWRDQDEKYNSIKNPDEKVQAKLREAYLANNPEYRDERRKREVYSVGGSDAMANTHVEYSKIVDNYGANSPEAKLYRIDHPEFDKWAQGEKTFKWSSLSSESIPALRISAKYRQQDLEYDAIKNPDDKEQARLRNEYLAKNQAYRQDRRRREAYLLTNDATGEKFPTAQVENYVKYNEITTSGYRRERYLVDNPEFAKAMHTVAGIDLPDPKKVPAVQYDDLYDKYKADFDKIDSFANHESKDYIEDVKQRELARDKMRFANGKLTEFGAAEIRRNGYGKLVPEKYIERFVEHRTITSEGRPKDWPRDSGNNPLPWYDDDWYLIEHPDYYKTVYLGIEGNEPKDFSKTPSREVFKLYAQYVNLVEGKPREDLRYENQDLDAWLLLTKKVTIPITEKIRRSKLSPKERMEEELKEFQEKLRNKGK